MQEDRDVFQMYLDEMAEIPACGAEENRRLLEEMAAGSAEAKNRLIEGNLHRAMALTREYIGRGIPAEDLVQEANLALLSAAETCGGEVFEMFLEKTVRSALEEAVRCQEAEDRVGEEMAARVNVLQDLSQDMARELGREATVEELAERMKMTPEEIREIMKMTMDALSVSGQYGGFAGREEKE